MEFKGTKGKWEIHTNEFETHNIISDGYYLGEAKNIHDAKLIACAPELLDALRGLMSDIGGGKKQCGHDFDCRCAWDKADELIKRATE